MEKETVRAHFDVNAEAWIREGYQPFGDSYPTAFHRARIVTGVLGDMGRGLDVADLGCGGGDVAFLLAGQGHRVVGIDSSTRMLEIAMERRRHSSPDIVARTSFLSGDVEEPGLPDAGFDAVVCMGLIGYLNEDEPLFVTAHRLLRPGGVLVLSCRNRLFNMVSPSWRTEREIRDGKAIELLAELRESYHDISAADCRLWLTALREAADDAIRLLDQIAASHVASMKPSAAEPHIEARQHTPEGLAKTAHACGFRPRATFGVHPHILDPNAIELLPRGIYNGLSASLERISHLPVSVAWSSVFISVFEK